MQLGQPTQGTHPEESGLSILDYLLHDRPTIADKHRSGEPFITLELIIGK
ncbi:hypothetical protein NX722_09460 [Endozoicomonas gorgoniicola]|uniref:Uncharacterized protein n=1 Tax=Endozoicomonas gorgoniicola TaxID=1234144 RepID=A0ABT3MU07_9GAMM|nr:hypothetical protein [Endozoicomonas gorgoniicola]MCW7552866.1 hypothetical protein [Endozoicomonas gorgoniicola]